MNRKVVMNIRMSLVILILEDSASLYFSKMLYKVIARLQINTIPPRIGATVGFKQKQIIRAKERIIIVI
jgi:hypothetical protein